MTKTITELAPRAVWAHFAALNAVPRPSKQEERVIAFMKAFGESLGLPTIVDRAGNVIIKKPAAKGYENRKTVILQAHLDMVHQKNAGTDFDFQSEGIRSRIEGEWVKAEGTTLGADNGMGVAAIMAVLADNTLQHPPLEALFTIDEETGMTGAKQLDPAHLKGEILLNLDSEEDDELTIGCAGGVDTNTRLNYQQEPTPENATAYLIRISGLKGGHSGMDIHKDRGNANKMLVRLLYKLGPLHGMSLAAFDGGSLRNAIPREAQATVVVPNAMASAFEASLAARKADLLAAYQGLEPDLKITCEPADGQPGYVMAPDAQEKALSALYAVPNGVFRMSPDIPGLVETSSSLARVVIKDGVFATQSLQRSAVEAGKKDVAQAVRAAFESIGAEVENDGDYPGWAPNAQSPALKVMQSLYEALFQDAPKVAACHAGLECGILNKHLPHLDMISFGPTIRNAHSPDEMVHVPSVQKFWKYLVKALEQIGQ